MPFEATEATASQVDRCDSGANERRIRLMWQGLSPSVSSISAKIRDAGHETNRIIESIVHSRQRSSVLRRGQFHKKQGGCCVCTGREERKQESARYKNRQIWCGARNDGRHADSKASDEDMSATPEPVCHPNEKSTGHLADLATH